MTHSAKKRKKIKLDGSSSGSSSSSSNSSLNSAHYYCVAEIYTTALAKVGIGLGDLLCEINGNSCVVQDSFGQCGFA